MLKYENELSPVEEFELVFRARQGDDQAKEALILSLVPRVRAFAFSYKRTYHFANKRLEGEDLCQEALLKMWEKFSMSLDNANPCAYLMVIAFTTIRRFCSLHKSLIATPDDPLIRDRTFFVDSLDAPLSHDEDSLTLLDIIPSPGQETASETTKDYTPLYQAIERLPKGQRSTVVQHYGVYETEVKDFTTLYQESGVSLKNVSSQHKKGLYKLQAWLAPTYPSLYDPSHRPCAQSNPATTIIPPDVRMQLDRVRCEKADQWQGMNAFKLRKAAKVEYRFASAYLRQEEAMSCAR